MLLSPTYSQRLLEALVGQGTAASSAADGTTTTVNVGAKNACWLGLSTTKPGDDGSNFTEPPAGRGYRRVNISSLMSRTYKSHAESESAAQAHDRRIGNTGQIAFHEALDETDLDAATGGDWGTLMYWGYFTTEGRGTGTPYAWGELDKINGSYPSVVTHNVFLFRDGHFENYLGEPTAGA